jgi:hypothetical protein
MAMFGNSSFKGIQFPQIDAANLQQHLPAPEPKEPSFFGQGGTGRNIAGYIGDALLTASGGRPVFAPARMQQHQMQQQMQMEEQRRRAALETWQAQQVYKAANPDPTDLSQRVDYLNSLGGDLGKTYATNYANNGGGAPQIMNVPGVGIVAVPKPSASTPSAPAAPQPGTVEGGYRFKGGNPADPSAWEQVGGAPSAGGGTFR